MVWIGRLIEYSLSPHYSSTKYLIGDHVPSFWLRNITDSLSSFDTMLLEVRDTDAVPWNTFAPTFDHSHL